MGWDGMGNRFMCSVSGVCMEGYKRAVYVRIVDTWRGMGEVQSERQAGQAGQAETGIVRIEQP